MHMYLLRTTEIRWFFTGPAPGWLARLEALAGRPIPARKRTDYYLPLPGREAMGIKLREGRLEVKYRLGQPEAAGLGPDTAGFYEHWVKRGFSLADAGARVPGGGRVEDRPAGMPDWIPVEKERFGLLIRLEQGQWVSHLIGTPVSGGTQIEYTRLRIGEQRFFSLGLEWPEDAGLQLPDPVLELLLGGGVLQAADSMGYPQFFCLRAGVYGDSAG